MEGQLCTHACNSESQICTLQLVVTTIILWAVYQFLSLLQSCGWYGKASQLDKFCFPLEWRWYSIGRERRRLSLFSALYFWKEIRLGPNFVPSFYPKDGVKKLSDSTSVESSIWAHIVMLPFQWPRTSG